MRRAIVTGALGFLGSHLVRELQQRGVHVTALTRKPRSEASYIAMGDAPWCSSRLARIIEMAEPDIIFHMAGGRVGPPVQLARLNVGVAIALMHAIRGVQLRPLLVCCGSAAEYGKAITDGVPVCESATCAPASSYGATKLTQTNAALAFAEETGTPVLVTRIFNPIGPGMPAYLALGDFARQIAIIPGSHGVLRTGNIDVCRDFIDVKHVVAALITLAENPEARGIVNICSGRATALRKLANMLIDASAKNITIATLPARQRRPEVPVVVGSTERLAKLGAAPPPANLEETVARVWQDAALRWAGSA
jgi:GDP-4-dehydro-6-deoxy-D-mannose reductase